MTNQPASVFEVAARSHAAFAADRGQSIRFTDLEGAQPIDFWAFNREDISEYLSCEHTKPSIDKVYPGLGDSAYTNHRRPIVTLIEDNSPGQHDMQFAACDPTRYVELGVEGEHASCQDNLHQALTSIGIELEFTPQPWNLFTNFFINPDGTFTIKAPDSKPGDHVVLRAEMAAHIVVSACPQDQNLTCGGNPTGIRVEVRR